MELKHTILHSFYMQSMKSLAEHIHYQKVVQSLFNKETFLPSIRYLVASTMHEIPNFICYLAVPAILFSLASV